MRTLTLSRKDGPKSVHYQQNRRIIMHVQYSRMSKNAWVATAVVYGRLLTAQSAKRSACGRKINRRVQKVCRNVEGAK